MSEIALQLNQSVSAIQSPYSTNAQRMAASNFCEEFKTQAADCHMYAVELARAANGFPDETRQFGLHVLEYCIEHRWDAYTPETKDAFKQTLLGLIADGMRDITSEAYYNKEKIARVVVEMAKRDWPQRWPSFFDDLPALCELGDAQLEVVLIILRTLAEDTMEFNENLAEQRCRDLHNGMAAAADVLFPFFIRTLSTHAPAYYADKQSASAGSPFLQLHLLLARASLQTLAAFLQWVKASLITESRIMLLLCELLQNADPLSMHVLECISAIVERRGPVADRVFILELFDMSDSFFQIYQGLRADLDNALFYSLLKRLCQVLVTLATDQLCVLIRGRDYLNLLPQSLASYFSLMLAFSDHESILVCSFAVQMWLSLARHDILSKTSEFEQVTPLLLQLASAKIVKTQTFLPQDFETRSEYTGFFALVRNRIMDLVKLLSGLSPLTAINSYLDWLQRVLSSPVNAQTENGRCTTQSPSYIEWDALTVYADSVMVVVRHLEKPTLETLTQTINPSTLLLLKDATEGIIGFQTSDPLILARSIGLLSAHVPLFRQFPELIPPMLEKLFASMAFKLNEQPWTAMLIPRSDENQMSARRRACTMLVKMSVAVPDLLLSHFDGILAKAQELIANELVTKFEQTFLLEALVSISNSVGNLVQQAAFLDGVYATLDSQWQSPEVSEAVSSPQSLLKFLGLVDANGLPLSLDWLVDPQAAMNRGELLSLLTTLVAVTRRIALPAGTRDSLESYFVLCGRHLKLLLPNLLQLIRTLHAMWEPGAIPTPFAPMLEPSDAEVNSIIGYQQDEDESGDEDAERETDEATQRLVGVRHWLTSMREMAYKLLAQMMEKNMDLYTVTGLDQVLFASVFSQLESPFFHSLLRFCPPALYASVLLPVLPLFMAFMGDRIAAEWTAVAQASQPEATDPPADQDDAREQMEMYRDKNLREVTREYIDCIGGFLASHTHGPGDASGASTSNAPGPAIELLCTEGIGDVFLHTCITCMLCSDTSACQKAVNHCVALVPVLTGNPLFFELVGRTLFHACIRSLSTHGKNETCQSVLMSLIYKIYGGLLPHSSVCREALLDVPNVTVQVVDDLDAKLTNKTERAQKEAFRYVLHEVAGINSAHMLANRPSILSLPEKSFLQPPQRPKEQSLLDDPTVRDFSFANLFGK